MPPKIVQHIADAQILLPAVHKLRQRYVPSNRYCKPDQTSINYLEFPADSPARIVTAHGTEFLVEISKGGRAAHAPRALVWVPVHMMQVLFA